MTLDDIKARCFITEDGCWEWRGALSEGRWPRVHAPDLSKPGAPKTPQPGRRAVWQMVTGEAIPKGHRVYGTCECDACLNPEHMNCGTTAKLGRFHRKTGRLKGRAAKIAANRKIGRKLSSLTAEQITMIQQSDEHGTVLAERLNVTRQAVSKARRGKFRSFAATNAIIGMVSALVKR